MIAEERLPTLGWRASPPGPILATLVCPISMPSLRSHEFVALPRVDWRYSSRGSAGVFPAAPSAGPRVASISNANTICNRPDAHESPSQASKSPEPLEHLAPNDTAQQISTDPKC